MAITALFSQRTALLQDARIVAMAHELLVVSVFFASFAAWRHLSRRTPRPTSAQQKLPGHESCAELLAKRTLIPKTPGEMKERRPPAPSPQVKVAEDQMMKHLEQREFTRALNLYRTLERDGRDRGVSFELRTAFIQSAIRVGKVDVVDRMLRSMKRNGTVPPLAFWQTTMKMLSGRKHFSACLSAQSIYGGLLPDDKVVYSCLINAALEVGAADRAAAMLQRYRQADLDAKDHVLFFRTYVALGDADAAEAIFRKLGDEITTLMLNLLLLTAVNAKQPRRAAGFIREAYEIEARTSERLVDTVSYNTVIKGFVHEGLPQECFTCLHDMLDHGLDPDDITFGTLLDACITGGDTTVHQEIVGLLMGGSRTLDASTCALFLRGLVRADCVAQALELHGEIRRRGGMKLDIMTYSVLIKALVDRHDLERALRLVEDMTAAGHRPDDIILTHLLEGCRHTGNGTLGKKLFEEMLAAGVKPSEFTLVTMLKLHGRCGAHREAHDLVASWEADHGLKPSVIHFTCLMSGCLRTKSYDQAWAAYELMCSRGIAPDSTAVATLLPGMVAAQQWDRVLVLARRCFAAAEPIRVPGEALSNAVSQMLASGASRQAEQLQALTQSAGMPVALRADRRGARAPPAPQAEGRASRGLEERVAM